MKNRTLLLLSIFIIVASLLIVGGNAKALDQLTVYLPVSFRDYCPPLFADDFSDSTSGWPVSDDGNRSYEYLNNEYRILVRNTGWWVGARPGFTASDYILTVDVRNITMASTSTMMEAGQAYLLVLPIVSTPAPL
jgi:hypothetical protein